MSDLGTPDPKVSEISSKKRKAEGNAVGLSRKRVKSFHNEKYRQLYNSVVTGHFHSPGVGFSQYLSPSQIGSSVWTVAEKVAFFHLVARKGRHDFKAILLGLGSKSEPEIAQYINLLRDGLVDAESSSRRPSFLEKQQFETACEISPRCMASLDRAGDALSILQQEEDEKTEREKQGNMWLLTPRIGNWVDKSLMEGQDNEKQVSELVPEAMLLNLELLLRLSKRLFMNSSDLEYNWSSYAEQSEEPTILHSAFTDFHTLALAAIKRLIQSTLHFAISRLRAEQYSNDRRRRVVAPEDVATASRALDMRDSMKSYWSRVPRRCNLRVCKEGRTTDGTGETYSHDEVELLLNNSHQRIENEEDGTVALGTNEDKDNARLGTQAISSTDSELDEINDTEPDNGSPLSQQDEETFSEEEKQEQNYDAILECSDQRKSQAEEARLWELLDENDTSEPATAEGKGSIQSSVTARKDKAELVDWASEIEYGTEWETLGTIRPVEHFT